MVPLGEKPKIQYHSREYIFLNPETGQGNNSGGMENPTLSRLGLSPTVPSL